MDKKLFLVSRKWKLFWNVYFFFIFEEGLSICCWNIYKNIFFYTNKWFIFAAHVTVNIENHPNKSLVNDSRSCLENNFIDASQNISWNFLILFFSFFPLLCLTFYFFFFSIINVDMIHDLKSERNPETLLKKVPNCE